MFLETLVCIPWYIVDLSDLRLNLQIGTLLYVRVVKAETGMNPELSCMDGRSIILSSCVCVCYPPSPPPVVALTCPFCFVVYAFYVMINMLRNCFCSIASGKAAEYGPLKEGFMFETSTGLSRTYDITPC